MNRLIAAATGKNLEFMNQLLMWQYPYALKKRALTRLFRRNRIRAVLAEFAPTGAAIMDACHRVNMPLIVHFHGHDAYNSKTLATYGSKYPALFRTARHIVAVSEHMRQRLITLGAPEEKMTVIPCGVDTEQFSPTDPAKAGPIFVAVSRLVSIKAPQLTLLAFSKVVAECPEARLTVVGDGPLLDCLEQLRTALHLEDSVTLAGVLEHSRVRDLLANARAFVQHSMRTANVEAEGSPLTLAEAGAVGLPVVTSRCGGTQELVKHGETGYLVDQGDVEAMARYMLRLAREPALAAQLGAAGRRHVEARYSQTKNIAKLWRVIENAL